MEKVTLEQLLEKDINGKVICFPTDTVYGVGAVYNDIDAINKIYEMKNRSEAKPLAILTPSKDIEKYIIINNDMAHKLISDGWPGALTLIFRKSALISYDITKGRETVAFRMPKSDVALAILKKFGPLATTSVNLSGEEPLNNIDDIEERFGSYIDYLVTDQEKIIGKASRIIDVSTDYIKVIRD